MIPRSNIGKTSDYKLSWRHQLKKRVRALTAGLTVGVAALAAATLTATPAAAALKSLNWHINKSEEYCGSLPDRTTIQRMKKAECESQVLAKTQIAMSQAIARGVSTAEVAAGMNWPGPGH